MKLERGASLAGRIFLPSGVPAERVQLSVGVGSTRYVPVEVADDGSFGLHGLEEGLAEIVALAAHGGRRYYGRVQADTGDQDVSLSLGRARRGDPTLVRLSLEDVIGHPVEAQVSFEYVAHDAWGGGALQYVSESQTLHYDFYPTAKLYFFVRPVLPEGLGETVVGPIEAGETDVTVRLRPGLRIQGRIVDPHGEPVAGVGVSTALVHPSPKCRTAASREPVLSSRNGAFVCDGLGEHDYVVSVAAPPRFAAVEPRTIRAGTNDVRVVLRHSVAVTLTVLDEDGVPIEGAVLMAHLDAARAREDLPMRQAVSDADGRCRLVGLDGATAYFLEIRPPSKRVDLLVRTQPWKPRDLEVRLQPAYTISGRLQSMSGGPTGRAWVGCRGIGMPFGGAIRHRTADGGIAYTQLGAWSGADGTFAIGKLRGGRYELSLGGEKGAVTVEAGSSGIVLTTSGAIRSWLRFTGFRPKDRGVFAFVRAVGSSSRQGQRLGPIAADGRLEFSTLVGDEDEYEIWLGGLAGGRYAWEKRFAPKGEEIDIPIQQGGIIRGRILAPAGVKLDSSWILTGGPVVSFSADLGLLGQFPFTRDETAGTFEIQGVPPGEWSLSFGGTQNGVSYEADVIASPGDELVVKLGSV